MPIRRRLNYKKGKNHERFAFNGVMSYGLALRILDIQPNIPKEELKDKYRSLVLQYHPDRYTGDNKTMQAINVAMDYLCTKR